MTLASLYAPIVLINRSKLVTDAQAAQIAKACDLQISHDLGPAWARSPVPVSFMADQSAIPANATVVALLDDADPSAPDALAYHTEEGDGEIYAPVFCAKILGQPGASVLVDVSSAASHEIAELFEDAQVNLWADAPDGFSYAKEICDPVESDSYPVNVDGVDVMVSNFVHPSWFDDSPPEGVQFDQMGKLGASFALSSGGYAVRRSASGQTSQVFGERYPAWRREGPRWRRALRCPA